MRDRTRRIVALAVVALLAGACSTGGDETPSTPTTTDPASIPAASPEQTASPLPQGSEPVELDPANFVDTIDHPYWPMTPGSVWTYREASLDGTEQHVEVTVTAETKVIQGITATVVHDVVTEDGALVEDTLDWYAQDVDGSLWYLGEDTKEFEDGEVVSTAGSWEHGVDGAQAGIILPADPQPGMTYRQEYYAGDAEDLGAILSLDEWVTVPFGFFEQVLMTKDHTPLEPKVLEHKFYAEGVGPVMVVSISGGTDREELLTYRAG